MVESNLHRQPWHSVLFSRFAELLPISGTTRTISIIFFSTNPYMCKNSKKLFQPSRYSNTGVIVIIKIAKKPLSFCLQFSLLVYIATMATGPGCNRKPCKRIWEKLKQKGNHHQKVRQPPIFRGL